MLTSTEKNIILDGLRVKEIKFKAFDKINEKVYDVIQIYFDDKKVLLEIPDDKIGKRWEFRNFDDVKLMQYIGLKDNDGEEIYNGYILYFENEHLKRYSKIFWNKRDCRYSQRLLLKFKAKNKKDVKCYASATSSISKMKIVGNIYENPELMR